ncbi:MAG: ribokinase [Chloroflexaceae bacterium]|nr:ribokinase [Chloroflexaceae bacterium]
MIDRLAHHRILVVGDVSLDEYLFGRATRLSREAAVPVLEWLRRDLILGGAANPSRNIVALGGHATQLSIIGDDAEGTQIQTLCEREHIDASGLIALPQRPTTVKTRILADQTPRLPQHLARLDRLDRTPLSDSQEQPVIDTLQRLIPHVDAVLCSDYQLGMLTPSLVATIRQLCREHRVLLTVDAQGNSHYYRGVDLFRCNDLEAAAALGRPLRTPDAFQQGLRELQQQLEAHIVMVTRGPDGCSLIGQNVPYMHLEAFHISEVYDTTGAGDTFIAVATLALVAGFTPLDAARFANVAAALVVRRLGNSVVTPEELLEALKR